MPAFTFEQILTKAQTPHGCGVLVVRDGKILTGTRIERAGKGRLCGPGGHIEPGETPEEAAKREAMEEFNIECNDLKPLGVQDGGGRYGTSAVFLCTDYTGTPRTDEEEMTEPKWRTIEEIKEEDLFPPFEQSLGLLSKKGDKMDFTIYKADDDKHLVFGWASIAITVDGEVLEDRQHDMIDPEDLEEAAYEYVLNFRDTGEEHLPGYRKKGKLVESCVLTAEKQKAIGIPQGTVPVGWWIGFKIEDDDTWQRVKNGTYKMFSIEGKAERLPVEKSYMTFEEVLKLNFDTEHPAVEKGAPMKTYDEIVALEKRYDNIEEVQKFNPNHDALGRFSTSSGAASFTISTRDSGKQRLADTARAKEIAKPMVAAAKAREPKLTATMKSAAKVAGGEMDGLDFAVKGTGSLTRKIRDEAAEKGISMPEAAKDMKDVNRYTMKFTEENFVDGYNKAMKELQGQGYEIVKVKNTLKDETAAYRGVNTNLKAPDGSIFELQFHTQKSLDVKEPNHKLYEEYREKTTSKERKAELDKLMSDNAKSIPTPPGIENIKDIKFKG